MRRSGESNAIEGAGDEDSSGQPRDGAPSTREPPPTRPYDVWLKIEKPRRQLSPSPTHLSQRTWTRLSRQIGAYLRKRLNNNVTLRSLVRVAAAEMRLAGATPDEVAAALNRAVLEHPELAALDRINVVTRRLASEELLDHMLGWAREREGPP